MQQDFSIEELNDKFCELVKKIYKMIRTGEDNKSVIVKKLSTGQKEKRIIEINVVDFFNFYLY